MGIENFRQTIDPVIVSRQNAEKITKELEEKSRYKREHIIDDQEKISSPELGNFSIDRVKNPEDSRVEKIFDFMQKFNPEEADTLDIIKEAIKVDIYAYHIVEKKDGEVVAHTQSSYLEIASKEQGAKSSEAILFIGYSITDDDFQRKGLASELFSSVVKTGAEKANKERQGLKAVVGECVDSSERFWNHTGLKRMYFEDDAGNFHEVPYVCPPIQWDEETGKPLDPETEEIGEKILRNIQPRNI